jgi:predicted glycoside hydrolase/deacetylase ChbG (UPF0249 family)
VFTSIPTLQRILQEEVKEGWTEVACHPGYVTPDFSSVYLQEREEEVRTLTDLRIRQTIETLGIQLVNYTDYLAQRECPKSGDRQVYTARPKAGG